MSAEWQTTACILCECNCGIEVQLEDRTLARIRGDKRHPSSKGYTCNKAMRLDLYQNGPHRLTSPLRRREDGTYEEIGWDTAISEIAARLRTVIDEHGGEKVFFYGGGGQGNHLGGTYSGAVLSSIGCKYRANAQSQEKSGEQWVDSRLYGGHTRGDLEHAEVALFPGKNPWQANGFARARLVLKEIEKDPDRSMIVIDPVITDTAKMADFHLRVRPGSDAWCLAALGAVLVQEDLCNEAFLAAHVNGYETVRAALAEVPVADYAERCGVPEELIRATARRLGETTSIGTFEDLGIQQAPNSTLSSYLSKLLWIFRGAFGTPGGTHMHSSIASFFRPGTEIRRTPVTGAPIVGGLTPCNVIPDEILGDHPDRFRAMIIESGNPLHSLADSARMREALRALELSVVVDVAMTETARFADYVLPASSQYEKCEATFFNFEFPHNVFHLRHRLIEPLEGTLPEPEIWARLLREMSAVDAKLLDRLRDAAHDSRASFAAAFAEALGDKSVARAVPYVLYETLGATLPDEMRGAASLWGLAQRLFMTNPEAVLGAGFANGDELFDAILESRSGLVFTADAYKDAFRYIAHPDKKIAVDIPEMVDGLHGLRDRHPGLTTPEFPIALSAGERRAYTANDIFRNPAWRKRDADGALRVSVEDAERYGLVDGGRALITTAGGRAEALVEVNDSMQLGHAALPNGLGLDFVDLDGELHIPGVSPNDLTSSDWCDEVVGTPLHKHVPARIEPAG